MYLDDTACHIATLFLYKATTKTSFSHNHFNDAEKLSKIGQMYLTSVHHWVLCIVSVSELELPPMAVILDSASYT